MEILGQSSSFWSCSSSLGIAVMPCIQPYLHMQGPSHEHESLGFPCIPEDLCMQLHAVSG